MIALGIDPGLSNGAAVLLDMRQRPAVIMDALAWSEGQENCAPVMRRWRCIDTGHAVESKRPIDEFRAWALHAWITGLHGLRVDRVGVEWVPPGRTHGVNKEHLRECGRMVGFIQAYRVLVPETPTPAEWRRSVFGLRSNLKGPAADAAILARLPALVTLPDGIPPWALKHLPDACGVALSLRST
jgi:hypothetical protein